MKFAINTPALLDGADIREAVSRRPQRTRQRILRLLEGVHYIRADNDGTRIDGFVCALSPTTATIFDTGRCRRIKVEQGRVKRSH